MKMSRVVSTTMCGLVLLVGGACTNDPGRKPAQSGASGAGALVNQGVTAAGQGRLDEAKAAWEQAVKIDPKNKLAWFNLGWVAQSRRDPAGAIQNYDKALESDPSYGPAMFNKAIVLEASDREAAIVLYRKILASNKKGASAHFRLGLLLDQKGDKAGARGAFAQVTKLDAALAKAVPPAYRDTRPSTTPSN
jgi:tetratricopeptide (TPR) repeat protein